ncbi:MAG: tRNA pseudouridine(38-40) synthase TruA [Bacteroidaceae bacterium]|nr:tRNA pseudouridine(38-40) synthase TruA [Bacteroidaceae bacterium]
MCRSARTAAHFFNLKKHHPVRYFIYFSYDGAAYHGWQIQPNANSVQEELNNALSTLLRKRTDTVGAGRTDSGVNARLMVAHFDAEDIDTTWLTEKLNRILPPDIAVCNIRRVHPEAHARFDATSRTYHYYVYSRKNPFLRHYATRLYFEPDYLLMNEAAQWLLETEDFTSFSKLHTDTKTNNCRVEKAQWVNIEGDLWRFEIKADRFLRNMVRAVVGTLLEVGRKKMSIEEFRDVIALKNRCAAGDSVPGNALQLVEVAYPKELFID